jgi:hypothetical protein
MSRSALWKEVVAHAAPQLTSSDTHIEKIIDQNAKGMGFVAGGMQ